VELPSSDERDLGLTGAQQKKEARGAHLAFLDKLMKVQQGGDGDGA
jgi:hypothetical protein